MRLSSPDLLIDIRRLGENSPELSGIVVRDNHVHIGALATHAQIGESAEIREHLPLMSDAAQHIAHPAIRNAGTLGGSLATADPAAEWPACCVALNARMVLACKTGTRSVAARDFFKGLYATALRPCDVLTEVVIPIPGPGWRHVFMELARRRGDYAIVGVAALARIVDGSINDLQLAYLGAGDTPVLAVNTSQVFVLKGYSENSLREAQHALAQDIEPAADLYASAATKLHLARVLTARAMKQLCT